MPLLARCGFEDRTGRRAWRRTGGRIDVVECRSFGAVDAERFGCTAASLALWAGSRPDWLPFLLPPRTGPAGPRPEEAAMLLRIAVHPGARWPKRRLGIWRIDTPEEAEAGAEDAARQLEDVALGWLDRPLSAAGIAERIGAGLSGMLERRSDGSEIALDWTDPASPWAVCIRAFALRASDRLAEAAECFEAARWARDPRTGERLPTMTREQDALMVRLAAECRSAARTGG